MSANGSSPQNEAKEIGDTTLMADLLDEWEAPIVDDQLGAEELDMSSKECCAGAQGTGKKEYFAPVMDDEAEKELAGEEVQITFVLEGSRKIISEKVIFFMGQTVEVLKMYLEKMHHLPYSSTTLYLDEIHLIDPLSLVDLPFDSKKCNEVTVHVKKK